MCNPITSLSNLKENRDLVDSAKDKQLQQEEEPLEQLPMPQRSRNHKDRRESVRAPEPQNVHRKERGRRSKHASSARKSITHYMTVVVSGEEVPVTDRITY